MALFNRLYFYARPFLPVTARMAIRRRIIANKLRRYHETWPIDKAAARPPENWPGWPENKKFSFVLTHDVEGPRGLNQIRQLAETEMRLGFRSSFNLVPEGSYRVPDELRHWLTDNGFEVGVHDLRHDGKLYLSKGRFRENAQRINHYLKAWKAVGFRSGFMLRRLDWMHQLDVVYDASTFDTDPFEPQPDGACTIFPFWVPHPPSPESAPTPRERGGFVELPYTLPQDSTLFLYLGHRDISVWLRKLDWIVERGGMVLVNVHPDYLDFTKTGDRSGQFPSDLYVKFLETVRERYDGTFWHGLPRNLVSWWLKEVHDAPPRDGGVTGAAAPSPGVSTTEKPLSGLRAAAVLYSYYPADPRPRRAAEAMAEAGMHVEMICLRENTATPPQEVINGVHVTRVPLQRRRAGKLTYLWQYLAFTTLAFATLTRRSIGQRYDVVHAHNMPDFLVFTALIPRLRGAKVLLDLHDPMPELCMSIFGLEARSFMVKVLIFVEYISLRFAHLGITPNLAFKKLFVSRSCPDEKMKIIMNSPQEHLFPLHAIAGTEPAKAPPVPPSDAPYVIMFHGSLVHRHGLDIAVEALDLLRQRLPRAELRVFGAPTPYLEEVLQLARSKGLGDAVHYCGEKPLKAIAEAIQQADVGLIPNRRLPFTELNFPTRIFEYLSMGKPVIVPTTAGIMDYFTDQQIFYFEPGDAAQLADVLQAVHDRPAQVLERVRAGQEIYRNHLWSAERRRLVEYVSEVVGRR